MTTVPKRWRKSSRSGPDTNCVEVETSTHVGIRDSKNPAIGVLDLPWAGLVAAVKGNHLTR